ncbi:MAG: carbohydrate binding domain-containing protein, partial [Armatimonadota bacterium]|nr:carbohydrate binding domain-containing protein [Armatimonadota bacterium]
MTRHILGVAILISVIGCGAAPAAPNLVANGDFEREVNGVPESWSVSGDARVKQQLLRDVGRDGKGFCGKLVCTEFGDGSPSSHAMICQVGVVALEAGKWYRLAFWAKGEGIVGGAVNVAIANTRTWQQPGLSDGISIRREWRAYELIFRAPENLPAEVSRLQFWFGSTGTFWIDDVELTETDIRPQWHPRLAEPPSGNWLPNSSFECGTAGWGSYSPDLRYWHGNVYRLIGEEDTRTAAHGRCSLRVPLSEANLPTYFFDYFDPLRQPMRCVVAAHHGWVPVEPGKSYTLSAYLKADAPGRVGVLLVRQAGGRSLRQDVTLTTEWQRYTFTFVPESGSAWAGV